MKMANNGGYLDILLYSVYNSIKGGDVMSCCLVKACPDKDKYESEFLCPYYQGYIDEFAFPCSRFTFSYDDCDDCDECEEQEELSADEETLKHGFLCF